jgi:hypothetical protein
VREKRGSIKANDAAVVREVGEQEREREFDSTKRAILHAESA